MTTTWKIYNTFVFASGIAGGIAGAVDGIESLTPESGPLSSILIPFSRSAEGFGFGMLYGVLAPITVPVSIYYGIKKVRAERAERKKKQEAETIKTI